jgi:SAM-dependent methyltransferase
MTAGCETAAGQSRSLAKERRRLEEVAEWYDSRSGLSCALGKAAAKCILRRAKGGRALELGCANGVMTRELARRFEHLDVVEGAERYAREARAIVPPRGQVYNCLFEEYEPTGHYDVIVMAWVLEHVVDPGCLLKRADGWLSREGEIHIFVPNAESLHRRVGLQMGMLERLDVLNDSDMAIGHRRVYTWGRLADEIEAAGLRLVGMEGILLKPLPSAMVESWPRELLGAFFEVASLAPRVCSEIYAICRKRDDGDTTDSADGLR